ncbi:hypothetical protein IFR04_010357 [Cadophora malorum]|uniref:O-methyltransferase n=1 Tax=Cadophora malorum TaxID=108018 RepID=A0A8H7W3N9_9HELO|nr:hypothetical protein IFR04_010357 [Cadophora malorum]
MEDILSQIKLLAHTTDDSGRKKIQNSLQGLLYSLESEPDVAMRLSGLPLQITCARIGADLKIFSILSEQETSTTVGKLAEKTGAAEELLCPILRYLASIPMVSEPGEKELAANKTTRRLAQSSWNGAIYHSFDTITPVLHTLPSFLHFTNYRTTSSSTHTAFQTTFSTPLFCFQWLPSQPGRFRNFQLSMGIPRASGDWLDVLPFEEEVEGWSPGEGVGVGKGDEMVGELKGRFVLQDLREAVEGLEMEGVEVQVGNFWGVQSVNTDAKFYYLRAIIHDYPDDEWVEILKNIIPARGSSLVGFSTEAMGMDLMMMVCFGALERTQGQWETLVERTGLKIVERYVYNEVLYNTVVVFAVK